MTLPVDDSRALAFLAVRLAERSGRAWARPDAEAVVRKLDEQGDRPSTILARFEAAASDPNGTRPDAALWAKFGNTRARPPAAVEHPDVCSWCGLAPDACAALQAKIAPEYRDGHEFTPRRRAELRPRRGDT